MDLTLGWFLADCSLSSIIVTEFLVHKTNFGSMALWVVWCPQLFTVSLVCQPYFLTEGNDSTVNVFLTQHKKAATESEFSQADPNFLNL